MLNHSKSLVILYSLWSLIFVKTEAFSTFHLPNIRRKPSGHLAFNDHITEKMLNKSRYSTSSTRLNAIGNLNFDDLIYNAQSSASDLASYTLSGAAESGTSSITSLALLFFAGLLTSFSPCSLSLLPLTVSYISTAAGERDDKAAFFPTLAFAAGLAFVFCGLGLSVSLLGGVFGQSISSSDDFLAALGLIALSSGVSITMGLQLLDIINIPLPSLEVNLPFLRKESESSSTIEFDDDGNIMEQKPLEESSSGDGNSSFALLRVFLLGGSCALLESPCATPVLTSILAFVGVSQNPFVGATLLLAYTLGYSTPLLVVGATGGEALAKLQATSDSNSITDDDEGAFRFIPQIGQYVSPFTGGVLIWYGTNSLLTGLFGDASLSGLSPVL